MFQIIVIFVPYLNLSSQVINILKVVSVIETFLIRSMTSFNLSILRRLAWIDEIMQDISLLA